MLKTPRYKSYDRVALFSVKRETLVKRKESAISDGISFDFYFLMLAVVFQRFNSFKSGIRREISEQKRSEYQRARVAANIN